MDLWQQISGKKEPYQNSLGLRTEISGDLYIKKQECQHYLSSFGGCGLHGIPAMQQTWLPPAASEEL
jgi:hypothetical protein